RDGGPRDGGPPPRCPDGTEGCACTFSLQCVDPGLTCFGASPMGTAPADQINVCLRLCAADAECGASTIGNALCRPVRTDMRACVAAEVTEGLTIDFSRRVVNTMTGCADDLFAMPAIGGSGLGALEDDQASCGRPCDPNAVAPAPNSCTATYPYCNPDVLASVTTPGICTLRPAQSGDVCSRSSVVGLCDTASVNGVAPSPVCLGVPFDLVDPDDPSPMPAPGMCVVQCNLANPNCGFADDPMAGPAVCRQVRASNTTTGICSNDCGLYPSPCGRAAAFGLGSTCTGDLNFEPAFPFAFCRNVMPPTIPEYNFAGAPPASQRCLMVPGGETRCEANTRCLDDGMGGLCIRTCSSTAAVSGCLATGNTVCDDSLIGTPTDGRGACRP
ncbi:MAG: hypothetical protein RL846_07915, partial [Deltaproteobacteria bacterium]